MRPDSGSRAPSPWLMRVASVWAAIILVVSFRSYFFPQVHSVYPCYARAGANWSAGRNCYDVYTGLDPFRYSPVVAAFFIPFSLLPESLGGIAWRLLSISCFLGAFYWYQRVVWQDGQQRSSRSAAWLWFLLIPLGLESLNNGQANLVVVAALLAASAAVASERWNVAAACLAVAFFFKLYPLALALLFVAAYHRPLGWRLLAAIVFGCCVPFLLQRPGYVAGQYWNWFALLAEDNRVERAMGAGYRDCYLLFRFFLHSPSSLVYQAVQLCSAIALAILAGGAPCRARSRDLSAKSEPTPAPCTVRTLFDLGCCWMILFGPATESSTYVILAPTLAFALVDSFEQGERSRFVLLLVLAMFVVSFLYRQICGPGLALYVLQPLAALILLFERGLRIFPAWKPQLRY